MAKPTWDDTQLFAALKERKGDTAKNLTNLLERPQVMRNIEEILSDKSTTPKNFTLHDEQHSFRVAERMWDLIPDKTKKILSDYELALLLMAAYLHDMGMSPAFEKVERHRQFLTSQEQKDQLNAAEIKQFQKWIDNDDQTGTLDIGLEIVEDEKSINYILSYYIRHKHNDWSGEWISEHLKAHEPEHYAFWNDDLIALCKSHHYGMDHLLKDVFDPKPMNGQVVHLRYLMMCLRVADVMENDPKRTPEVILQHRSIDDHSVAYWLKDHRFQLPRNKNQFTMYARPERAYLLRLLRRPRLGLKRS